MLLLGYAATCKVNRTSIPESDKACRRETIVEVLDWYSGHRQQIIQIGQVRTDMELRIQTVSLRG